MKANIARETQYDHRIAHAWHLQPRSKSRCETHAGDNISKPSLFANMGLHGCRITRLDGTKTFRQLADEGLQALPGAPLHAPAHDHNGQKSGTEAAGSDS